MNENEIFRLAADSLLPDAETVRRRCLERRFPDKKETVKRILLRRVLPLAACAAVAVYAAAAVLRARYSLWYATNGTAASSAAAMSIDGQASAGGKEKAVSVPATVQDAGEAQTQRITVNRIASLSPVLSGIALLCEDFIPMGVDGLIAYLQCDFIPQVPADMTLQHADDEERYGIYRRDGGTGEVYWDQNTLEYSDESGSRMIRLTVAGGKLPFFQFEPEFDGAPVESVIGGRAIAVCLTDAGEYYAEFTVGGAGIAVCASGLTQQEFIGVLASIGGTD